MDASPETSVQTLAGIGAGPVPAHDLAGSVHQAVYPDAVRRELLATGETVRTRSVETRDRAPSRLSPRGIDAISITMRAARQAFSG